MGENGSHFIEEEIWMSNKDIERYLTSLIILKMEIKTRPGHHCIPTRWSKIKYDYTKCSWGYGRIEAQTLSMRVSTDTVTLESSLSFVGKVDYDHSQGQAQPSSLSGFVSSFLGSPSLLSTQLVSTSHQFFLRSVSQTDPSFSSPSCLLTQHASLHSAGWLSSSPWFLLAHTRDYVSSGYTSIISFPSLWRLLLFKAKLSVCAPLSVICHSLCLHASIPLPSVEVLHLLESPSLSPLGAWSTNPEWGNVRKQYTGLPHSLPNPAGFWPPHFTETSGRPEMI